MNPLQQIIFLLLLFSVTACHKPNNLIEQRILSFGTLIDITIAPNKGNKNGALLALKETEALLKQRHHQWHSWLPGDLSTLNEQLKSQKTTSLFNEDLKYLIQQSKDFYDKSNELFNPALGTLIEAWGFHDRSEPDLELIQKIQTNIPTMDDISVNNNSIINSNPYLKLDFGGIAKGLAIEQIRTIFQKNNIHNYLINMGGDLYANGSKFGESWRIGIQNPYQIGSIGNLNLESNNNLFTSGSYQRFDENNKAIHHIIDPRTGKPSTQANAVTVYHTNPITADVAATALMIAKPSEWSQLAKNLSLTDYLIIKPDKSIWVTQSLNKKITFNTELKIHIIDPI